MTLVMLLGYVKFLHEHSKIITLSLDIVDVSNVMQRCLLDMIVNCQEVLSILCEFSLHVENTAIDKPRVCIDMAHVSHEALYIGL
jgi:hypothetical protein